jgi:geranylgeranyl transferase type-2 subunit beta
MLRQNMFLFPFNPAGVERELRERSASFLLGKQNADGGFAGRSRASDIYYTSFALRCLHMLERLSDVSTERLRDFIVDSYFRPGIVRLAEEGSLDLVHLSALMYSLHVLRSLTRTDGMARLWRRERENALRAVELFRQDGGGYSLHPGRGSATMYHTFLAVTALELIGCEVPAQSDTARFVASMRNPDGGYRNHPGSRMSSTNPTSTAVLLLRKWGLLSDPGGPAAYLVKMRSGAGFRATANAPLPDIASSFSSALALFAMGPRRRTGQVIDYGSLRDFVMRHEDDSGGFRSTIFDPGSDAEYTFYGMCALSLISYAELRPPRQALIAGRFLIGARARK